MAVNTTTNVDANARAQESREEGGRGRGGQGLLNKLTSGYGRHRHGALHSLGPKLQAWSHPGNFTCLVCTSVCLLYYHFPPPPFVLFVVPTFPFRVCSSILHSRLVIFVTLFPSSIFLFISGAWCAFSFCFASSPFLFSCQYICLLPWCS